MTTGPQSQSVTELLGTVLMHVSNMAKGEIALAKAELGEKLQETVRGLVLAVIGLVMVPALIALIFITVILGLMELGMSPFWAALIVTCFVAAVIAVLLVMARGMLRWGGVSESRTARSLRRDAQTLKEIVRNDAAV